jgi:hypothetical protein
MVEKIMIENIILNFDKKFPFWYTLLILTKKKSCLLENSNFNRKKSWFWLRSQFQSQISISLTNIAFDWKIFIQILKCKFLLLQAKKLGDLNFEFLMHRPWLKILLFSSKSGLCANVFNFGWKQFWQKVLIMNEKI